MKGLPGNSYKKGSMVWRVLGALDGPHKSCNQEAHISLQMLQTIIVEVEALLNDRPLTYISLDPKDPEPLMPSHLLSG